MAARCQDPDRALDLVTQTVSLQTVVYTPQRIEPTIRKLTVRVTKA